MLANAADWSHRGAAHARERATCGPLFPGQLPSVLRRAGAAIRQRPVAAAASSDRVLYWGKDSQPCWRVLIALAEKELPYESKQLDWSKGEHKSPEVMAINPRGQLPSFKDGDVIVNESLAALMYLEDAYDSGTRLLPEDPAARALVWQRMMEVPTLREAIMKPVLPQMFPDRATGADSSSHSKADPNREADLAQKSEGLRKELALWEAVLSKSPFLAGDTFTLADVAAAPLFMALGRFGLSFGKYPALQKYYDMVKERPSVVSSFAPGWREEPDKDWLGDI